MKNENSFAATTTVGETDSAIRSRSATASETSVGAAEPDGPGAAAARPLIPIALFVIVVIASVVVALG